MLGDPVAAASSLLVDNAFHMLTAALLSTFPNTALAAVTDPEARSPRGQVSEAALRRRHDTSPAALLRTARLRGVHDELHDADPTTGPTVAAVAVRWGFGRRGPFRRSYVATFGEQPEDTLRR